MRLYFPRFIFCCLSISFFFVFDVVVAFVVVVIWPFLLYIVLSSLCLEVWSLIVAILIDTWSPFMCACEHTIPSPSYSHRYTSLATVCHQVTHQHWLFNLFIYLFFVFVYFVYFNEFICFNLSVSLPYSLLLSFGLINWLNAASEHVSFVFCFRLFTSFICFHFLSLSPSHSLLSN